MNKTEKYINIVFPFLKKMKPKPRQTVSLKTYERIKFHTATGHHTPSSLHKQLQIDYRSAVYTVNKLTSEQYLKEEDGVWTKKKNS